MHFGFNEEQDMIRKSAQDFVKGRASWEKIRELMETERGWSEDNWKAMAELGWLGAALPEQYGGMGMGYVELLCILEELGKMLLPEPLIGSAVLGANAILFGGSESQKGELLPEVASGGLTLAVGAYELAGRHNLAHVETTAKAEAGGYVLDGSKCFVEGASFADKIVVTARASGGASDQEGISLFIIDKGTPGLTITPVKTIDRRRRDTVTLKGVKVGAGALLGEAGAGFVAIEQAVDRATVALCAEMLGGMETALQMSVAYSKERVQFGKPIGSFQAIKHKAANMYVALETARSAVYYATMAVDEGMEDMRAAISCAKALCSDAYLQIGKDAIQIHGGIGFTHECDVPFFYKRAVAAGATFGDADYHRDRYADEKGF